tara:strand:+ start:635 stop:1030 length:396 start_codon:yes stop_codon:yes gene_type:complete
MLDKKEYQAMKTNLTIYENWSEQFKQPNGWTVIPKAAIPPVRLSNDDRSEIEHYEFFHNPPDKYLLYVNENTSLGTTWTGQKLGRVYFGNAYRSNFGDKRQTINFVGINGKRYHGTYYKDAGNYARIKAYV